MMKPHQLSSEELVKQFVTDVKNGLSLKITNEEFRAETILAPTSTISCKKLSRLYMVSILELTMEYKRGKISDS